MNREIKFRAWAGRQMHYLNPIFQEVRVPTSGSVKRDLLIGGDAIRIEGPWEVMQFTGLRDCDGKEIYESDVLEWRYNEEGDEDPNGKLREYSVVEWHGEGGMWILKDGDDLAGYLRDQCHRVVGNIYEHPELLKP